MMEQMTLNELKTGMHVITANGDEYVVMRDTCCNEKRYGKDLLVLYNGAEIDFYCDFSDYREDMTHKGNGDLDIIKVYNVDNPYMLNVTHNHNASCENELIFMADIMTKADAEKKFGIRIID